jgi:hypothetical protein
VEYRVVDHPEFLPGCCFLSRTSEGPFIDTGIDVEDLNPIGRVYLAESTVSNFAQELGYAPPEAWKRAKALIADLSDALAEAQSVVAGLTAANDALTAAGYTAPVVDLRPPAGSVPEVLLWVAESDDFSVVVERARAARDAELAEKRPREQLLSELEMYLTVKEATT